MEKIKVAQIGVYHEHATGKFNALKKLPDIYEIVGYWNDNGHCTTPRRELAGLGAYDGYKAMSLDEILNYPGLQAVTVEVPNNDLVPIAMKCMEKGLAMHMDKPAGEDLALYKKLLDGCKAKNLPFQMGFMFRGNPAFKFCIQAVRNGLLGDVFEIECDMNHNYGGEEYQEYIGKFPGGIMWNLGCHLIDFVYSAMGAPAKITPFMKAAPGYPATCYNNCMSVLEYDNNAIVTLRACSKDALPTMRRTMKIVGTKGTIRFSPIERFDGKELEVSLELVADSWNFPKGNHTLRFPAQTDRYTEQLRELAAVIRGEKEIDYSYEHDYMVHKITMAASGLTEWST